MLLLCSLVRIWPPWGVWGHGQAAASSLPVGSMWGGWGQQQLAGGAWCCAGSLGLVGRFQGLCTAVGIGAELASVPWLCQGWWRQRAAGGFEGATGWSELSCPPWDTVYFQGPNCHLKAKAAQEVGAARPAGMGQRLSPTCRAAPLCHAMETPSQRGAAPQSIPVPSAGPLPQSSRGAGGGSAGSGFSSFEVRRRL